MHVCVFVSKMGKLCLVSGVDMWVVVGIGGCLGGFEDCCGLRAFMTRSLALDLVE